MILPNEHAITFNGSKPPSQTVLAYCLALDAYAQWPIESMRRVLQLGAVPPNAPYAEWAEAVERALTIFTHPPEVPPCPV